MRELFGKHDVDESLYNIFNVRIEDFQTDKKYDIIIAESFLQYLKNQQEVIDKLKQLSGDNGIIVITCGDDVSIFVELMKRLIGQIIIKDTDDYNQKVQRLVDVFGASLGMLRGVSRSVRDWVQDQLLNPALVNGCELTLIQAIEIFGDDYEVLGSSPGMFTDYSWYKDIWFDYKSDYAAQYRVKQFSLLKAGMPEVILPPMLSDELIRAFKSVKALASEFERMKDATILDRILIELNYICSRAKSIGNEFDIICREIYQSLKDLSETDTVELGKYQHFFAAFGRTQHYMAFQRAN